MLDNRLKLLAKSLVNYSTKVKKGDKCLVTALDTPPEFVAAIVEEIWAAGGKPFVRISSSKINEHMSKHYDEDYIKEMTELNEQLWKKIQVYISINDIGEEVYSLFKSADIGDIVGVYVKLMLTGTGELTIKCL